MEKFEQYKLDLSKKEKELVTWYLEKINQFIKKHDIDKELYNDIEEMVFEKLSKEKHLDQLKIIKILKEVWEPEIIFSDYLDEDYDVKKVDDKELFFQKLIRYWWVRNNKNAWVLWISETLANKIWVPVLFMRIILILLIFVWWLSIWLYIIAWIILPIKWKDYSEMDMSKFFRFQIKKLIKDWAYNLSTSFIYLVKYISMKSWIIIKFFLKNIFPVFRFIICFSLALFFLSLLFALLVIWAMYFSSFSLDNIDFTSVLPSYFIYWVITWIIALAILSISNFVYAFTWKNINKYILSVWWISLLLAIFFWLATWFDLVQKYAIKSETIQNTEIDLWTSWSWHINIDLSDNSHNNFIWNNSPIHNIKLENTTWSVLKATIKNTVYGNEEISRQVFEWLNNLTLKNENNNVTLSSENNKLFNKKVPFSIIEREIVLKIPEWYSININNTYWFDLENVWLDNKYEKYNGFINTNCNNNKIWYKKEENKFVCDLNPEELENAKKEYLQKYVVQNFDTFSTIKHKKRYKREYTGENWYNSDWNFYDFNWEDSEKLNFNFGDRSLDINATIKIEDTASWVLVSDFKIEDVRVFWDDFERYYEDINPIKEFIEN